MFFEVPVMSARRFMSLSLRLGVVLSCMRVMVQLMESNAFRYSVFLGCFSTKCSNELLW
jgi:hypothetical protein